MIRFPTIKLSSSDVPYTVDILLNDNGQDADVHVMTTWLCYLSYFTTPVLLYRLLQLLLCTVH